jgi:hypothetical protein
MNLQEAKDSINAVVPTSMWQGMDGRWCDCGCLIIINADVPPGTSPEDEAAEGTLWVDRYIHSNDYHD